MTPVLDSRTVLDPTNVSLTLVGLASIGIYYTIRPTPEFLYIGGVAIIGGIAGIFAAWRDVSRTYRQRINVLTPVVAGGLLVWFYRQQLIFLPFGIAAVLAGLVGVVRPSRKDLYFAIATLGCIASAVIAVFTATLPAIVILLLGAMWMARETYRSYGEYTSSTTN